jgi:hypothetical protein
MGPRSRNQARLLAGVETVDDEQLGILMQGRIPKGVPAGRRMEIPGIINHDSWFMIHPEAGSNRTVRKAYSTRLGRGSTRA